MLPHRSLFIEIAVVFIVLAVIASWMLPSVYCAGVPQAAGRCQQI